MRLTLAAALTTSLIALTTPAQAQTATAAATTAAAAPTDPAAADPHLWLEDVLGERALTWVREQNARSLAVLEADPRHKALAEDALAIIRATDRLTFGGYADGYVSNFWQDATQVRGLWRRADLASWRSGRPAWETVLDIDKLAADEGKNWVYQGAACLDPVDYWASPCLLSLSDGGKDANVKREFSLATRTFVAGGFSLPEAKSDVTWFDADTLLVATDWGAGTLTESGYPFVVKRLRRGQALSEAVEVFRGQEKDVAAGSFRIFDGARFHHFFNRAPTFFTTETHWQTPSGGVARLALPDRHTVVGVREGRLIFSLQEDWKPRGGRATLKSGTLASASMAELAAPSGRIAVTPIYVPGDREALQGASLSKSGLYVTLSRNVRSEVRRYVADARGRWRFTPVDLPANGVASVVDADVLEEKVFFAYNDFLTPPSILMAATPGAKPVTVQAQPARFDASGMEVSQFEATSKDGTKVPYFLVRKKGLPLNGQTPTLLYGYGGFEVSLLPDYSPNIGKLWLERGGAYVLANIRGGGEFGPAWHQAGLKGKRQVIYDDFIAVAEDLIARKVTSPRRLGIQGGSNGGLLMGVMLTQRPDLFNAAVVQVPLLDMLRYDKLLAGASWVDEYGDPDDPAERPFLETISPYQNLRKRPDFPEPFLVTSTKDDRVHPGHARKFAARMQELGMLFYYYENIDGGHSAAANLVEAARRRALEYTYLMKKLMD
jgi:prolyl oligopeptidase